VSRSVALLTLGCARNEVDSEELAGRLEAAGWDVTDDAGAADAVLVNTCGFIAAAKQDSIAAVLDAHDTGRPVVAVGCMAERYGAELAAELPEAAAVLGFDDYAVIGERLEAVVAGTPLPAPHQPRDRRSLLPITPVQRPAESVDVGLPGHAGGPHVLRRRLDGSPVAPLKIASGCDRRCSFCAIPAFRGRFVSRPPEEVLAEARWLADRGVREVFLVSENSTSYGKDLGDLRLLERLLPQLAEIDGIGRVRVSYLQPAEMRPGLIEVMTGTAGVAAYFDLSFQHASGPVLRAMRRFGDRERFLDLIGQVRAASPAAGIRSNVIVGFPGESEADLGELRQFITEARLDAVGVFGYSDEDGTAAAEFPGSLPESEIAARVTDIAALADEMVAQRAEDRIGQTVRVLVESAAGGVVEGRGEHQAPEVDGSVTMSGRAAVGDVVTAVVTGAEGADLIASLQ
jgi:ribosomal protein S12 methylthiotransferase RimO